MFKLPLGLVTFLLVFGSTSFLSAETNSHDVTPSTESQTTLSPRPTQAAPLTDREMDFISDNFFISKVTIWNKYSESLPSAIEKAIKDGDESESSKAIAELMGLVNKKQAQRVLENAKKEKADEVSKKPNGGDERYIALMERVVWGAKAFLKDPSKEESAEKYNQSFKDAFANVTTKNEEILEKIKQAAEGNEQAKEWLRKNLDQSSLLSFAEGQKKYGNSALADRIIDAVSFKDGKNKFLDMSLQTETQRLHLGQTSQSVSTAFDKFIENRQGFNGAVVAFSPLSESPMKQWFVDGQNRFTPGAPPARTAATSAFSIRPSSGASVPTNNPSTNSVGQLPAQTAPSSTGRATAAYQAILKNCNQCHNDSGLSIDSNGVLTKDGSTRTKAEIFEAFSSVRQMNHMSPAKKAEMMNLVNQWLK
jgi:mono/diheme cytochrome c family protein